jgi:hypothetical protein
VIDLSDHVIKVLPICCSPHLETFLVFVISSVTSFLVFFLPIEVFFLMRCTAPSPCRHFIQMVFQLFPRHFHFLMLHAGAPLHFLRIACQFFLRHIRHQS